MTKRKILIIDDESLTLEVLQSIFAREFDVTATLDPEEGVEIALRTKPHLVLVDLQMPKMNGIEVVEKLRQSDITREVPVLLISGQNDLSDRVMAFHKGADDFIMKPYSRDELYARVLSKIRRHSEKTSSESVIQIGNLVYRKGQREALISGQRVPLSQIESDLVELFLENQDHALDRQVILRKVWKDTYVSDRTIDRHIVSLRKKLHGFDHELITIYGMGYALKKKLTKNLDAAVALGAHR